MSNTPFWSLIITRGRKRETTIKISASYYSKILELEENWAGFVGPKRTFVVDSSSFTSVQLSQNLAFILLVGIITGILQSWLRSLLAHLGTRTSRIFSGNWGKGSWRDVRLFRRAREGGSWNNSGESKGKVAISPKRKNPLKARKCTKGEMHARQLPAQ